MIAHRKKWFYRTADSLTANEHEFKEPLTKSAAIKELTKILGKKVVEMFDGRQDKRRLNDRG